MPKSHWELKEESDRLYSLSKKYFGLMWSCVVLAVVEILASYFCWLPWWITVPVITLALAGAIISSIRGGGLDTDSDSLELESQWAFSDPQMDVGIRYDQRRGASLPKAQRELQDLEIGLRREQRSARSNMRTGRRR